VRGAGEGQGPVRPLADHDLHRRPSLGSHRSALFDGSINGEAFLAYVRQFLVPTLSPGDVVIMDNLGSHRGKLVRKAIRQAGARLLFLPKYSPDLNPIEQVFSKLKHLLRKAQARSYDTLLNATAELLDRFTPAECANYFRNSGYRVA
jgi:transposase